MSTWSTRAAVRGTGPPWSLQNPELLRLSRSPSQSSTLVSTPPPSMECSEPGTPIDKLDWLQECQLTAHGDLTVTERLATLLDTGQFADVTIRVGQGSEITSFKAHRLLLATASQPLYRLVSTVQHGHADLNTFRVTDMDPAAFKSVLKFIYTDVISIDSIVEAFALLKAGKKWNLKKMNVRTIKYLEDFLEEFNPTSEEKKNEIFDLLMLAEAHSQELYEKCLSAVIKHAENIIPCQGFLRLDERNIRRLIGDSRFVYENQLGLFEAIRDWGMNQILLKGLNPTHLHPTIEDLLGHVNFEQIKDNDFMGTILPSECLGRAEVIAFFMTRGMEIPRDMGFNNNKQNGEVRDFKKVCRFKRGFRLPHKEIYQEHEVRFRVDKNIKLLGVGFGFLFSNTDMGVSVHCQGPWERVQWTDMAQTYCRVSWEKMNTADLRLMFSEPARLEADHSYKVLVKVTRMTAGSTDVELWGGKDGVPSVEAEDAKFYFIKAAVDPKKEVDPRETDTKQGMITELLYIIDDSPPSKVEEVTVRRRRSQLPIEDAKTPTEEVTPSFIRKRPLKVEDEPVETSSLARRRDVGGSYHRWQHPAMATACDTTKSRWATKEKTPEPTKDSRRTPEKNEVTSYYVRKRPSPVRERKVAETPGFLRPKTSTTTPASSDSPFGERLSRPSARTPWSSTRSSTAANDISSSTGTSRYGRDSTTGSSLYSSGSSRYGRETSTNRDTSSSTTGRSTLGDTGTTGSSLYGTRRDSETSSTVPSYRRDSVTGSSSARKDSSTDSTYTTPLSSLTRSNSSVTARYARDLAASRYGSTRYGRDSSASRYGTTYGSSYGTGSTSSSRFLGSSYTSRYR